MKLLFLSGTSHTGAAWWLIDSLRRASAETKDATAPGAIIAAPGATIPDAFAEIPVCGLHLGSQAWPLPPVKSLLTVFTTGRRTNELLFIPEEFITALPACPFVPSADIPQSAPSGATRVCISTESMGWTEVIRMIAGLNLQHGLIADMLVPAQNIPVLAEHCNPHVRILPFSEAPSALAAADVLIGSGQWCIEGLFRKIPVIVAGAQGFGGLVTLQNIGRHVHHNFAGRFGGVPGETIPFSLVAEDLAMAARYAGNGASLLEALFAATPCISGVPELAGFIQSRIATMLELERKINQPAAMADLRPKFVNDVLFSEAPGNGSLLLHKHSGKVLAQVTEDVSSLLQTFDGTRSIGSLGADEDGQLAEFVAELWREKLICFEPETD